MFCTFINHQVSSDLNSQNASWQENDDLNKGPSRNVDIQDQGRNIQMLQKVIEESEIFKKSLAQVSGLSEQQMCVYVGKSDLPHK
jgi:hypothetical protein